MKRIINKRNNVKAMASATLSNAPHRYILYGSNDYDSMSASADPDQSLDIRIRVYRTDTSRSANDRGAGGYEYASASNGRYNWRFRVSQVGGNAGKYTYNGKWSRT